MNLGNETTYTLVLSATEKLFMAISHVGDHEADKVKRIIEEALWNVLDGVMYAVEDKTE